MLQQTQSHTHTTMTNRQTQMMALNPSSTIPSFSNTTGATNDTGSPLVDKDTYKQKTTITKPSSESNSTMKSKKKIAKKEVPHKKQATTTKRTYKRRQKTDAASKPRRDTQQSTARPPRRVIPECKDHLFIPETEPRDSDVVSGRGGKSNHHIGNRPYWERILQLRSKYRQCHDDDSKRLIAQTVVDHVHNHERGRFLQRDAATGRWFVLPPKVIMDKCKQALRDKYVPKWAREEYGIVPSDDEEAHDEEPKGKKAGPCCPQVGGVSPPSSTRAKDCCGGLGEADSKHSATDKKRPPATPYRSPAPSRPSKKATSKRKNVTNKSTRNSTAKKSPPKQPTSKRHNVTTENYAAAERRFIAKLKQEEEDDDVSRNLPPTTTQGKSAMREEEVTCAAAEQRSIVKVKQEEDDDDASRILPSTTAQGKSSIREDEVARYDDLKEAIEQNLPSLSLNSGDPVGEFSFGRPLSFGDFNNVRGDLGSTHATAAASGGGGINSPLVSAALDGTANVASLDMVGNMINQWEHQQGQQQQQQESALSHWQSMFNDELRDALMNPPTNFDQV